MNHSKIVVSLVFLIVILAAVASLTGIITNEERGLKEITSVHGEVIELHGRGIYHNMSADVAVQGIGQDYVTFFMAIPLLIFGLFKALKGSLRWRLFLAGVLGYFFVNYWFYTAMGMYNELFLIYVSLMGLTFFGLSTVLFGVDLSTITGKFSAKTPFKLSGIFLIVNASMITLLWLQVVVPPLLDGTIIPKEVQHYTTLIVQGFDLGLLLPLSFVTAVLFLKRKPLGFLLAPVYLVFLSLLMTALLAKLIAMSLAGVPGGPSLIIIPSIMLISYFCAYKTLREVKQ
ncbi:MAG: hypothetical protein ACLFQE_06810 [Thermotogota bacterium]